MSATSNLSGDLLIQSFKFNILYALKVANQPSIKIKFKFIDEDNSFAFFSPKLEIFGGLFTIGDVNFGFNLVDLVNGDNVIDEKYRDICIAVFLDNMHFDDFAYVDCVSHFGKNECHGHGEYWGTDTFTFIYKRFNI